jgi:gamma-glutamyltranspeptidase/glutathione hydrolase
MLPSFFTASEPPMRSTILLLSWAAIGSLTSPSAAAEVPYDIKAKHGCVVSVSGEASDVGMTMLARGGNAVDAAIATAFALAVTYPAAGNIGGGGFMMVHMAKAGEPVCIEYRETAPAKATKEVFAKLKSTSRGHLTVGVPGTVRGLALAHEKYGTIPWKELIEPAIDLAEDGFHIDSSMAWSLNYVERQSAKFPELRSVFRRPDTKRWQSGDLLLQKDLANTLRLIAEQGPDAFYVGPIAEMIVEEMEAGGGLISKEDLAAYQPNIRSPIHGTYRDYDIYAPPPPSSGGVVLIEMLNVLENFNLAKQGRNSTSTTHQLVETMRRAYYDRARYLGDPAFVTMPLAQLTSKDYARSLARGMALDHATNSADLGREILVAAGEESTTHFSVLDRDGNAVSNTYTLEESFGSHIMVHGAGFILNSELTDFNLHPGHTDQEGEIGTEPNQIAPGKRILSSQTPTIVLRDGNVYLVTGSPGSRTIINTVLQIITNVIDYQMDLREAVDAPRLHHQWMPDVVRIEEGKLTEQARAKLESMGHKFEGGGRQGDAHSILLDPETNIRIGAADKRISGKASGY